MNHYKDLEIKWNFCLAEYWLAKADFYFFVADLRRRRAGCYIPGIPFPLKVQYGQNDEDSDHNEKNRTP
jgi:hypothetical protein